MFRQFKLGKLLPGKGGPNPFVIGLLLQAGNVLDERGVYALYPSKFDPRSENPLPEGIGQVDLKAAEAALKLKNVKLAISTQPGMIYAEYAALNSVLKRHPDMLKKTPTWMELVKAFARDGHLLGVVTFTKMGVSVEVV